MIAHLIDVTLAAHGSEQRFPRPGEKQAVMAAAEERGKRWEARRAERDRQRREAARD